MSERAKTLSLKVIRSELVAGEDTPDHERPKTRGECVDGLRPCPYVGCKHHLYLDVAEESGHIKLNFPTKEPEDLAETCALDVAAQGGATLEDVAATMNITRERIRQIEVKALIALQPEAEDIEDAPEHRESPMAAMGISSEPAERSYVPRGLLRPPPPRALHRCKHCQVRTNDPDRAQHLERHGIVGDPSEHFTPDDSVQVPVGRPNVFEMAKLAARSRRAAYAAERVVEQRERGDEVEAPEPAQRAVVAQAQPVQAPVEAPKETTMPNADGMISTQEVADHFGFSQVRALAWLKQTKLSPRIEQVGKGRRHYWPTDALESVKALRGEGKAARKPREPKPARTARIAERAAAPKRELKAVKPPPKPRARVAAVVQPTGDLAAVVRALGLVVDLGKLDAAEAFSVLRDVAA